MYQLKIRVYFFLPFLIDVDFSAKVSDVSFVDGSGIKVTKERRENMLD